LLNRGRNVKVNRLAKEILGTRQAR
jgi:hypothetical protein